MLPKRIQTDVSNWQASNWTVFSLILVYFTVDLSLYKDESQIEKKTPTKSKSTTNATAKKTAEKHKNAAEDESGEDDDDDVNYEPSKKRTKTPAKKTSAKVRNFV